METQILLPLHCAIATEICCDSGVMHFPTFIKLSNQSKSRTPSRKTSVAPTAHTPRPTLRNRGHTTSHSGRLSPRSPRINLRRSEGKDENIMTSQPRPPLKKPKWRRAKQLHSPLLSGVDPAGRGRVVPSLRLTTSPMIRPRKEMPTCLQRQRHQSPRPSLPKNQSRQNLPRHAQEEVRRKAWQSDGNIIVKKL